MLPGPNQPKQPKRAPLDALLSDLGLGAQITRGGRLQESAERLAFGIPEVDRVLCGGLPVGALSEVSGAASSGRTSLALALFSAVTGRGELSAWIDGADAFDPPSAERCGVQLERVLWIRATAWSDALGATERLVRTEGFPLVLLDGTEFTAQEVGTVSANSAWLRLGRLLAASHTTLLLLSSERLAGPHAALAIEMQPARARFSGSPALLDELESRMKLVRHRSAPVDPNASYAISPARSTSTPSPHESAA